MCGALVDNKAYSIVFYSMTGPQSKNSYSNANFKYGIKRPDQSRDVTYRTEDWISRLLEGYISMIFQKSFQLCCRRVFKVLHKA